MGLFRDNEVRVVIKRLEEGERQLKNRSFKLEADNFQLKNKLACLEERHESLCKMIDKMRQADGRTLKAQTDRVCALEAADNWADESKNSAIAEAGRDGATEVVKDLHKALEQMKAKKEIMITLCNAWHEAQNIEGDAGQICATISELMDWVNNNY